MAEGARVEGGWAEGERVAAGMEEAGWEGETAMGDWGWEAAGCSRDVRGGSSISMSTQPSSWFHAPYGTAGAARCLD